MKRVRWIVIVTVLGGGLAIVPGLPAVAQYSSPNYSTNEVFFGSGGDLNSCSSSYCSKTSVGELGVGNSTSPSYQVHAGFNTSDQPFLEFVVTNSNINLGYLTTASATTATGTFTVRAWNSGGYIVRTQSSPPSTGGGSPHTLTALTSPTASNPGTEQFGINLVANTSPSVGSNPQQLPDSTFSFGQAATGYNTPNQFKYVKGDIIAQATQSTSITSYTISYIFNISTSTQAGQYSFSHVLVVTATY